MKNFIQASWNKKISISSHFYKNWLKIQKKSKIS